MLVLYVSVAIIALFVVWGLLSPAGFGASASAAVTATTTNFGWYYLLAVLAFLLFCGYLAFGRYGQIKLGKDDDEPEFTTLSWFAMLFSAGMGIGLVFWGVAEPVSHYLKPPAGITPETPEAARPAPLSTHQHADSQRAQRHIHNPHSEDHQGTQKDTRRQQLSHSFTLRCSNEGHTRSPLTASSPYYVTFGISPLVTPFSVLRTKADRKKL